jgi:diguanylate cyclase (GGDEF)-like protein
MKMRRIITTLGHLKTVILLIIFAEISSVLATMLVMVILQSFGIMEYSQSGLIIAVIVTFVIATPMSWYLIGSMIKLDLLENEMRVLATYDSLTGLLTRREFMEQAEYFHRIAQREHMNYSIIIADIDNFKEINDQYGHIAGDRTLETLGSQIQGNLRESDLACRYGGDEFLFFLPRTSSDQAMMFIDRLRRVICSPMNVNGEKIRISASMGLASFPEVDLDSVEDIIYAADDALYQAKENGGDQTCVSNITQMKTA